MFNIRRYIGIPFQDRSASFDGADCFGLIRLFYLTEFGYIVPDPYVSADDSRKAFAKYILEIQKNWLTISEPENFCVVAMAHDVEHPNVVQHFGIYINGEIVHTLKSVGSHKVPHDNYKWCIKAYHKWQHS